MITFEIAVVIFLGLVRCGLANDQGYWTSEQTTTAWWTPTTTSYWEYWTPSTTYTTCYTQENVVVTVTSVIPCPVTSTIVYWECCDQCATDCNYPPTTTYDYGVGTTTVTSYTTTTPAAAGLQTITSNGMVIVVVDTSTAATVPSQTASVVYQVVSDAQEGSPSSSLWSVGMFLAAVATIMILL
ncbi:hypothetical protein A1O3_05900 [Capronia epimyces CBS 606.96]|uniref:Uncharacterized protein n=1 Tax=Capronia epimyces CBS 606.96 TaxID=1182542 RepID=W9Y6G3_9EURO|nr:uncharacterized protein A1O3_05900 [Capronia epimyces CBS 606.96]EXJ85225.1 hypothetical protein A1O3_05900 [Capronia epimyces CBS 606.96]